MPAANIHDITESILTLEEELDLFELEVEGVKIWERVRMPLYTRLLSNVIGATSERNINYCRILSGTARSLRDRYSRPENLDLLVWCDSRRERHQDGQWWDMHTDYVSTDILGSRDIEFATIETPEGTSHHIPQKTPKVSYIDDIYYLAGLARELAVRTEIGFEVSPRLSEVDSHFEREFGVDIDTQSLVDRELATRKVCKPLFRRLLRTMNPEYAVYTVSYGFMKETFTEACQESNITTVELQHGVIHPHHFGYAFPGPRDKERFPDYLLLWGDHWKETVQYPLPRSNLISVGFPHIERKRDEYQTTQGDSIIFISQDVIGLSLSRLAVEFANQVDAQVVYKLHPNEYGIWRDRYPWLQESTVAVVSEERPLYELFSNASSQVGIFSTALYEGLAFDLETYLVDLPGVETMQPLLEKHEVPLVGSAKQLATEVSRSSRTGFESTDFFKPNSLDNLARFIDTHL